MNNPRIAEIGKATRFKPGESGNPNGHPKGKKNLKTMLVELLSAKDPDGEWSKSVGAQLIRKAFRNGDMRALEQIIERIEGKVPGTPLIDNSNHHHYVVFRNPDAVKEESASRINPKLQTG